MVKEVRIYYEGDKALKSAFGTFLGEPRALASKRKMSWDVIACGPGSKTLKAYQKAMVAHPNALLILLIDSEAPVNLPPLEHLRRRKDQKWTGPNFDESSCHLMVQSMESWFVADMTTLRNFYGQGFNENAIPKDEDVERIGKERLKAALDDATRNTSKGKYDKTRHAPHLLSRLNVAAVRAASTHCNRLFTTLTDKLSV